MAQQGPQFFDPEDRLPVHGPAIPDLALSTPTANETAVQDAVNAVLAALRSANIIAE